MSEKKSRGWLTILYDDSCNPDWQEMLQEMGIPYVYAYHDKDVLPDGELKKPHTHLLLLWDGPTTRKNASELISLIGGVGCVPCLSVRGSVRYFGHLDNPDKYQYGKEVIHTWGGLDLDSLMLNDTEELEILKNLYMFIRERKLTSYARLVNICMDEGLEEYFRIINLKFREDVWKYLRSVEYGLDDAEAHQRT